MSVVVPQPIGIFLRNRIGDSARDTCVHNPNPFGAFLDLYLTHMTPAYAPSIAPQPYYHQQAAPALAPPVTERNSYGLGYHNRQLESRNQSSPICNRNKQSNTKGSNPYLIPDGCSRSPLSFPIFSLN